MSENSSGDIYVQRFLAAALFVLGSHFEQNLLMPMLVVVTTVNILVSAAEGLGRSPFCRYFS